MLPKVATQILHQSTRAVATSSHSLRNVLTTSGKGSGSGSGNNGPGPKYTNGSRFYSGYTGAGRAVTQANGVPANDESEERNHALIRVGSSRAVKVNSVPSLSRLGFPRAQSTLVTSQPSSLSLDGLFPPPSSSSANRSHAHHALITAGSSGSSVKTAEAVLHFRSTTPHPSLSEFNAALTALHNTRSPGEPLTLMLETYNDMLAHSILPNIKTYVILILALTDRDHEIHKINTSLSVRTKRSHLLSPAEIVQLTTDTTKMKELEKENNYNTAMGLFDAIISINGNAHIPMEVYTNLIRSAAYHTNVDAAIHVFGQLEQRGDVFPSPSLFTHMLSLYTASGDLVGLRAIFTEFKRACSEGQIAWNAPTDRQSATPSVWDRHARLNRLLHLQVYNKMISSLFRLGAAEEALALLETMMNEGVTHTDASGTPAPASSTYTAIIAGFVQTQQHDLALSWFDRLLLQPTIPKSPYESYTDAPKPDNVAWGVIIDGLSSLPARIHDLNRLFGIFAGVATNQALTIRPADRAIVFNANMRYLKEVVEPLINGSGGDLPAGIKDIAALRAKAIEMITFVNTTVLNSSSLSVFVGDIVRNYLVLGGVGGVEPTLDALQAFIAAHTPIDNVTNMPHESKELRANVVRTVINLITSRFRESLPVSTYLTLISLLRTHLPADTGRSEMEYELGSYLVRSYKRDPSTLSSVMTNSDWQMLLLAAVRTDADVLGNVLKTMESALVPASLLEQRGLIDRVREVLGAEGVQALGLGQEYMDVFAPIEAESASETSETNVAEDVSTAPTSPLLHTQPETHSPVLIDPHHSRYVDEYFHLPARGSAQTGYTRFAAGLSFSPSIYPTPHVLGHLITSLGRSQDLAKLEHVYSVAQDVLASLADKKEWQVQAWLIIEDAMIVGLAHAGEVDRAHVHRQRILAHGGNASPSADAYGVLILYVRDTTDDTTGALALWNESRERGVVANVFLFNNIISKLAKARKADQALSLFAEMKAQGLQPSPITFGALVGACARVGDVGSAEALFEEMTHQRNFRARIPPYNTMMQMYTTTKPSREKCLEYYDKMLAVGVSPSEFTYKLLLDAYGTIEPVDVMQVDRVFKSLEADPLVHITGAHWASLINIHGCVLKDLERAQSIFDSISTHPSASNSSTPLPDALIYESMINVAVTHRRSDLIALYTERMQSSGVAMTAYIANFLIRGYALLGDLQTARSVFDALEDAEVGVASAGMGEGGIGKVFREPSTWEVMIRAELGQGNRQEAIELIERLKDRSFPEAVYNRIRGIMLDDSVSPWPAAP